MRVVLPLPSVAGLLALTLAACAPALNWREVVPPASGLVAGFPCRPDFGDRPASAEGPAMGLAFCEAGGLSFSLSWADLAEASQVGPALREMPQALAVKLATPPGPRSDLAVSGMTPHPDAGQFLLRSPGATIRLGVFVHGLRVYQALVRGPRDDAAAWAQFVESLRVTPR